MCIVMYEVPTLGCNTSKNKKFNKSNNFKPKKKYNRNFFKFSKHKIKPNRHLIKVKEFLEKIIKTINVTYVKK